MSCYNKDFLSLQLQVIIQRAADVQNRNVAGSAGLQVVKATFPKSL